MPEYITIESALSKAIEERRFILSTHDALDNEYAIKTIYTDLADFLYSLPRADVKEIKRGKWIKAQCSERTGDSNCSECGHWDWSDCKYCSNCGADMRGINNG